MRLLPLYIFVFAVCVELLQKWRIVEVLGVEHNVFLRVLIGSVYDGRDIVCYGVGCLVLGVYEAVLFWRGRAAGKEQKEVSQ